MQPAGEEGNALCNVQNDDKDAARLSEKRCFMTDTYFQTSDSNLIAASKLSVGDKILDRHGNATKVKWCQVHEKKKRLLVDLYTKHSMLTVTGSHRIVVPPDGYMQAKDLKKGDLVAIDPSGCEQLQSITKRHATPRVVELEFEGDATVPVYLPTILTKGSLPVPYSDNHNQCKQEPPDDASMDIDTTQSEAGRILVHSTVGHSDSMESEEFPNTDDGFSN